MFVYGYCGNYYFGSRLYCNRYLWVKIMPRFSKSSLMHLITCHKDLQTLFSEVIKIYDCKVICGYRNKEDQERAFREGASTVHFPHSRHNTNPSLAVDVIPYPVDWHDLDRFHQMSVIVKEIYGRLKRDGKIDNDIYWGGDWKGFVDLPHWEIK